MLETHRNLLREVGKTGCCEGETGQSVRGVATCSRAETSREHMFDTCQRLLTDNYLPIPPPRVAPHVSHNPLIWLLLVQCLAKAKGTSVTQDDKSLSSIEDIYSETRNIHNSPTKRPASKVLCYFRQKYLNHKRQRQRRIHKNLPNIKHHTDSSKVLDDCGTITKELAQDYKPMQESEVYVDIALSGPVPSSAQLLSTQGIAPVLQEGDNSLGKLLMDNSPLPRNLNSSETLCKSFANTLEDHNEINNGKENIHQFSVIPRRKPFLDVSDGVSENIQNCLSHKSLNMKEKKKNYEKLAPYKYFCPNCSFKTKRESHYKRHQKLHKQISQVFSCDKCNFTCIRQGVLRRHKMTHNAVDFACDKCNYRTDHYKYLLKHKRLKHWNNNKVTSEKKTLSCDDCEYSTTKLHLMERHKRSHHNTKRDMDFQCQQCSYKAIRKEHFMRHVNNVHNDKRPYLCDHCGKSFKRSDALKHHTFTTHGLSAYQCQVCSKIFRTQAQLNTHLAVHSNIRAFLCEVCGSSFKTRAAQYKHVLHIHKNPKAYSCTQCSRKFNTNYALRRHTKQHRPLALSSESIKPILWDGGWEGERHGVASQPTKVSFRVNKNSWIMETVDGTSCQTGLAEKSLDNKTNCMQLLEETSGVFCENPIIDMDATASLGMHIGSDSHMPPLTGNTLLIQDSLQLTLNDNQTAIAVQVIGVI
ncbi:unnamed protein product [Timema podura]|uniref:C2H2-type domain-containing protein n=1 Tax=Timema podura TaxID=61482 RepID=A0ABN7NQ85_TIMPD|nr:unnamed protein product [Timema podura]